MAAIALYETAENLSTDELKRLAAQGLTVAESLREFVAHAGFSANNALRQLHEELADQAECLALTKRPGRLR